MTDPVSPGAPQIISEKSNKTSNLSGEKRAVPVGVEAAIGQLARLLAMPGLAGDALRVLAEIAKSARSPADDKTIFLLFLLSNAEARARKLRAP